ncbi:cyclin-dependent kinase 11A-like [Glandiceps talaboti]
MSLISLHGQPKVSSRETLRETSPKAPEGGMNFNKLCEDDADIDKGFRLTLASQGSSAKGTSQSEISIF